MKKFSFLSKSSPVQPCRPLQAKFYKTFRHFQNQRGTNSATMHVKNSGWGMSNFQDLPKKKRNPTSSQHNILFSCSEDVKLSYQRQSFDHLEPRSRNDLDLQYSHNLINSISCLHLPPFRSQASIVSEKSTVFTFSYRNA